MVRTEAFPDARVPTGVFQSTGYPGCLSGSSQSSRQPHSAIARFQALQKHVRLLCRHGMVQHETGMAGAPWRAAGGVAGLAFAPGGDLLLLAAGAELFVLRRADGWAPRLLLSATVRALGIMWI